MPDTPLNPDALAQLIMWKELPFGGNPENYIRLDANAAHKVIELLKPHLAVAQPEVNSVEELAKAWYVGFCKGEQTAFRERPVNPDTINPYKNGETP